MSVVLFLFLVAALGAANSQYQPVCTPSNSSEASGPKLPDLPTAFSTFVQATFAEKNYTAIFFESYDQKADKGLLYRVRDGIKHTDIYDYTLEEVIHIDGNNCTVSSTNHSEPGHFNFFGRGPHIESVAKLFKFGKEYNETYIGISDVRGIRCHHWRSCISRNHFSFHVDYYFTVPEWRTPRSKLNSTVVRAVVNGSFPAHIYRNGTQVQTNGTTKFFNVYDFMDFHPGSRDPSIYQIPEGVYCEGYKGSNKTVPKMPPVFALDFEFTGNHHNTVISWQETYDVGKKLVAVMHPNYWKPKTGAILTIKDFNTGIGYNITNYLGSSTCSLYNITQRSMEAAEDENHHIRMKTTQELFEGSPGKNGSSMLVYKGSASVRGINADIWMGKRVFKRNNKSREAIMEWYFAKPNWRIESIGFSGIQYQVPLKVVFFTERGQTTMSVFNFNPVVVATEPRVFDIKPCFTLEEQRLVRFSLNDPKGKHMNFADSNAFLLSLTKAVGNFANVSFIRVNEIQVLEYKKEELVVSFVMLERPKTTGSSLFVVYPENGLMEGLDALNNSVNEGRFKAEFQGETLQAIPSSFVVGLEPSPPAPPPQPVTTPTPGVHHKQTKGGVSSGLAAGISILMLVVGVAGGLLVAHLIMKRRGTGLFQYQRQE